MLVEAPLKKLTWNKWKPSYSQDEKYWQFSVRNGVKGIKCLLITKLFSSSYLSILIIHSDIYIYTVYKWIDTVSPTVCKPSIH